MSAPSLVTSAIFAVGDSGAGPNTFSGSIVVGSQANRILVVKINNNAAATAVRLVDSSGASLSHGSFTRQTGGRSGSADVWYIVAPASATYTGIYVDSSYSFGQAVVELWQDVDQTTPIGNIVPLGETTPPSVSVSSSTANTVTDVTGFDFADTASAVSGQTVTQNANDASKNVAGSYKAGASSVSMGWTGITGCQIAFELLAASGGGGGGIPAGVLAALIEQGEM